MVGVRMSDKLQDEIRKWSTKQADAPALATAIRRLVEIGLTVKRPHGERSASQRARAKELAGQAIDRLSDDAAPDDDKASRKRRLLKGPPEFREARVNRSNRKG